MTYEASEDVQARINEIKSILDEYLNRISNAIQPKTLDELIKGLNNLIGPASMTRNLQSSSSLFYTFFMNATYRDKKDSFIIFEDTRDRLRELELELDNKISSEFSMLQLNDNSSHIKLREQLFQELEGLKEVTEDLEAQSQGFTDRTNSYSTNYPVDFIILSAHNIRKLIKRFETDYKYLSSLPEYKIKKSKNHIAVDAEVIESLGNLFSKFHGIVISLRNRHGNRPAFEIDDEYDVQDLLYSLLILYFEDIRREEWTPSYVGGSARMDVLLKKEKIVIECKKTRKGLGTKEVGDQLVIDIARYRKHADCKTLVCFVYDPERIIKNPKGLQGDLEGESSSDFQILIYIKP